MSPVADGVQAGIAAGARAEVASREAFCTVIQRGWREQRPQRAILGLGAPGAQPAPGEREAEEAWRGRSKRVAARQQQYCLQVLQSTPYGHIIDSNTEYSLP